MFDLEVNDFKEKEQKYQERIAELEAQENATKTLIGMRDAAWESAFNQAITIAEMAVLTLPNRDLVEGMIEGIKKPSDFRTVSDFTTESERGGTGGVKMTRYHSCIVWEVRPWWSKIQSAQPSL